MKAASLQRLHDTIPDDAVVLDIGGWGKPLARADWVLDHMPYATRGLYGFDGDPATSRFSDATWIERDICDREPFPFPDDFFDFVVCSHVLEDIRDPVWVCSEINRVGRAGYLETPSRLEEQSHGFQGPWTGWGHHRWLVEIEANRIDFIMKHHVMHGRQSDHFPPWFHDVLTEDEKVVSLWWEGSFEYGERIFMTPEELDPYLSDFVATELGRRAHLMPRRSLTTRVRNRLARALGS